MRAGKTILGGAALLFVSVLSATAQNYPTYEVVARDPNSLELRFHGVPLKAVHADDAQNALSIDFQQPVDGAVFDRLAGDQPAWVQMAYANYDNGVIRATRPVTFLTRQEADGFSLKMVPRGPVSAQAVPPPQYGPPPVALRGQVDYPPYGPPPQQPMAGPPPGPASFGRADRLGAARNYYALQLAVNRTDHPTQRAFDDATAGNADLHMGSEYRKWKNGDRVITSHIGGRLPVGGGVSLVGSLYDNDVASKRTLTTSGTPAPIAKNVLTGEGGFAMNLWDGGELRGMATGGNGMVGGLIETLTTAPDGYWLAKIGYHEPYTDTPVAVANHAAKDEAVLGFAQRLGYGFWGGVRGHYDRFEMPTLTNAVSTAGWNGNLRWSTDLDGAVLGLSYDGIGDYLVSSTTLGLSALGVRDMEVHAGSLSLSGGLWDGMWVDVFAGYAGDRFAKEGLFGGVSLRYSAAPGLDLELGIRHSQIAFTQGELGPETSGGLRLIWGFGAPTFF